MLNLASLDFGALDISGDNYLAWALDAKFWLNAKGLGDTIITGNAEEDQNKAKDMIFLRRHLHHDLKNEYVNVKDPEVLWKDRYDHQKTVILPRARYEWVHLRLQDSMSVREYNSAMFRIASKLEKTFSTFYANNVILQPQYCEKGFIKYSQLIACLLVAEQNNELLMKNHSLRVSGSAPFPEANKASYDKKEQYHSNKSGQGNGFRCGRGHGYRRRQEYGRGRGRGSRSVFQEISLSPKMEW